MVPGDGNDDEFVVVATDSEALDNTDFTTSPTRLASPLLSIASPSQSELVVYRCTQKGSRTTVVVGFGLPLLLSAAVTLVEAFVGDKKDFPVR